MGSKPVRISASRGAAVLGESDYQTVFEVWQRIREEREPGWNAAHGMIAPPEPDSAALRWGTAFEDAIVGLSEAAREVKIVDREKLFSYNDHVGISAGGDIGYITCHVDGVYFDRFVPSPKTLHEGKTTSAWAFRSMWGEPGTDHVPRTYQIQCQHQMLCTGAELDIVSALVFPDSPDNWEKTGIEVHQDDSRRWWVCNFKSSNSWYERVETWGRVLAELGNFHQYPIAANRDLQKLLVDGYADFWNRYILGDEEPDITRYEDIRRAFPEPVGTILLTDQEERWLTEYRDLHAEISASGKWGKRCDELKVTLLSALRGRVGDAILDDESKEKLVLRNSRGDKLGQYNPRTGFRVRAERE